MSYDSSHYEFLRFLASFDSHIYGSYELCSGLDLYDIVDIRIWLNGLLYCISSWYSPPANVSLRFTADSRYLFVICVISFSPVMNQDPDYCSNMIIGFSPKKFHTDECLFAFIHLQWSGNSSQYECRRINLFKSFSELFSSFGIHCTGKGKGFLAGNYRSLPLSYWGVNEIGSSNVPIGLYLLFWLLTLIRTDIHTLRICLSRQNLSEPSWPYS